MILWKTGEKSGLKGRRRSQILQLWSKDAWPKITAGFIPSLFLLENPNDSWMKSGGKSQITLETDV